MKKLEKYAQRHKWSLIFAVGLILILAVLIFQYFNRPCFAIPVQEKVDGTQGFRLWQGESLKSFEHLGFKMCVPEGWRAVGAVIEGEGFARFKPGYTGVVIKNDAFAELTITPPNTKYTVTIVYPKNISRTDLAQYQFIINRSFARVGAMFGQIDAEARQHTVLITAGLAGDTVGDGTRVYPDPDEYITTFVRTPDQPRAEELFLHAVMHLYNRHRSDLISYEKNQDPFSEVDFQEAEANWAETALLFTDQGRADRIAYMYRIHALLRDQKFAEIKSPPFNDPEENSRIKQSAVVGRGASNLDEQYGHYILLPLSMIAIEGLLQKNNTGASVEKILTGIHATKGSFMEKLAEILSGTDMVRIESWIYGDTSIPRDLVEAGQAYYSAHQ